MKYIFFLVNLRGTRAHEINPLQNLKHNYVKVFEKISVSKNTCCDNIQTKGH